VSSRDSRPALDPSLTISGGRDLVSLVGRLARERSWDTLTALFTALAGEGGIAPAALGELDTAARLVGEALAALPPPKDPRGAQADEVRSVALATAEALLGRCAHPPLAEIERRALDRAAGLLVRGGDHRRAALVYEELGADERAADAWGAMGDLDRMEAAHERDAHRAATHRAAGDLLHQFEALLTGGERMRALALVAAVSGLEEAASLRLRAAAIERRHALLRAEGDDIVIADLGSRTGVRLGGARLEEGAALPLRGSGEIALGATTVLKFQAAPGLVVFEAAGGLDRGLQALAGAAPLPIEALLPGTEGLTIEAGGNLVRLHRRIDVAVRIDRHLIGPDCDLLHGDVVEVVGSGARFEVE